MDELLKNVQRLQANLINRKKQLKEQRKALSKELKQGYHYKVSFQDLDQVVAFIEFCKTVEGTFKTKALNNKSAEAFSDQLYFTDTEVKK